MIIIDRALNAGTDIMVPSLAPWSVGLWRQLITMSLSGNVEQEIAPRWFPTTINVSGLGEPELEQRIVSEVATYGKQLGELTDVVLALARIVELDDSVALETLQTIAAEISRKKSEHRELLQDRTRQLLDELDRMNPQALADLLEDFRQRASARA